MRELSIGGTCVGLEILWKDKEGYVLYWTVVCYYIPTLLPHFSSKSLPHFNSWDANHLPWVLGNIWGSSEANIFPCPHIYVGLEKIRVRFRWKHPSNIKLHFVGWEVGLMLFTTCCLQPGKIPSLYNAFFACLDSFSEINLLGVLPHCNPTSQHYLQHQWSISPWKWNIWLQFLHVDRHCILLMELFELHVYGEKLFDLILVLRYIFISHFFLSYTQDHCWGLRVYSFT